MRYATKTVIGYRIESIRTIAEGDWGLKDMDKEGLSYRGYSSNSLLNTIIIDDDISSQSEGLELLGAMQSGVIKVSFNGKSVTYFDKVCLREVVEINIPDAKDKSKSTSEYEFNIIAYAKEDRPRYFINGEIQ